MTKFSQINKFFVKITALSVDNLEIADKTKFHKNVVAIKVCHLVAKQ